MRSLPRVLDRVQQGSLYGLLLLLPFSKAVIEIASTLLIAGWIIARLDPRTRADTLWRQRALRGPAYATIAFLLACILSLPGSTHPELSVHGFLTKWLQYLLLFVAVTDVAGRPGVMGRSLLMLAVSSALVLLEALTQEWLGRGLFRGYAVSVYGRMTGPYENPIDLATYFMVVLPVLLTWAVASRGRRRTILWGLTALVGLALARTRALGAWLGLGVGVVVMFAGERRLRRYGLITIVVLATAGVFFLSRVGPGYVHHHLFSLSDMGKSDRIAMWQAALGMIQDRPLFGHGLNTFMANYLTYWVGGEQMPRYAHNCYLQMAAETGVVGAAAFLWLLGAIVWAGVRGLRVVSLTDDRMVLLGILAGLTAFLAQAALDTNFYTLRQAALFWTLAGLAGGSASRTV